MNLLELRELGAVEVFSGLQDLFARLSRIVHRFDTSTSQHGECDLRLVYKLEACVEPLLGQPGIDDNRWFHEMDFYGDGVRLVEAEWNTLSTPLLKTLQGLLVGEHKQFCVLWKVYENFHGDDKGDRGAVAVLHERVLVTESILSQKGLNG